ncbi:MAG: galactokinase [Flavobacteriaceae bacterium]|nr:galactokinase [Flavobacteriaceae bacterium]
MTINTNESDIIVKSPGRINLIGEHIDYNGGHVLPAAIDRKVTMWFRKKDNGLCMVNSDDEGAFTFDINKPLQISNTHWENYVLGVVDGVVKARPNQLGSFDCVISSELPIGVGISSSAALECGVAKGLNDLFDLRLSDLELIEISRMAEHNFVGTKCGVMDQFAVTMGKRKKLLLLNCETLEYKLIDAEFAPYKILLLNTKVSHNLATSEYNTRREECEQALAVIQKDHPQYPFLAYVPESVIETYKKKLSGEVYQRALFVSRENARTLKAAELIQSGDIKGFGALMYQTHEGLSKNYEVSCPELDFLVDIAKDLPLVVGSRMMGGGFGGCTINLVEEGFVDEFMDLASKAYKQKFDINLTSILVATSNGVETVNPES